MESTNAIQGNNGEETKVRKSYHTPQLISLGEIQAIIQNACGVGADGSMSHTLSAS